LGRDGRIFGSDAVKDTQTIIAAGEASAARLPADRPAVYADWANGCGELQAFDPEPLAEAIDEVERGISRLIWGAALVAVVAALALFWAMS
jgi:hypothetical protein